MNAFTRGLVGLQLSAGINAARCLRLMTSLPRCAHASSHVTVFAPAIELKEHFQEVLLPGQRRQVGSCVVYRTGDMLRLERAAEPGNVQSEWDVGQRRTPDYAGTMADMASLALAARPSCCRGRVLMLGLGGGTIAGQLLLESPPAEAAATETQHASRSCRLHVTAIERDVDVAAAAMRHFFPSIFDQSGASVQQCMRVLRVDALRLADESVKLSAEDAGPFDVVIEDFGYEAHGHVPPHVWSWLRKATAPGGTLLINTLYERREEMACLAADLHEAGWVNVQQRVDRGLQMAPGESQAPCPSEWQPQDNMIFSAVNR